MTEKSDVALILPLYDKFAYGRRAALGFFKYTEAAPLLITLDDASPHFHKQDWNAWRDGIPADRHVFHRFEENKGLTRSWNYGLQIAREKGCKYAICGNSDVLFTRGWEHGLLHHANLDHALVGPVSNAPGYTNAGRQMVGNYYQNFRVTDDIGYLNNVADYLRTSYGTSVVDININGFFMLARVDKWWEGAFDSEHVFDPRKVMTGNEDELQRRWHALGWRTGFVPSSFIFHYRAVTRGERFKHTGWLRLDDPNKPL